MLMRCSQAHSRAHARGPAVKQPGLIRRSDAGDSDLDPRQELSREADYPSRLRFIKSRGRHVIPTSLRPV